MTVSSDDLPGYVAAHRRTRWLGATHRHHAHTGSTNDDAAAWAATDAPHGALVTADAQHAGRGRFGRSWHSPPASHVYASIVLRPGRVGAAWAALGLAVGVGLREGLLRWCPELGLKWPNDLVVGDRKLAGILCEARWLAGVPQIVVGFGINVASAAWPQPLRETAVALGAVVGAPVDAVVGAMAGAPVGRGEVLVAVLDALEPVLDAFEREGLAAVRERYEAACVSLGRVVSVSEGHGGVKREVHAVGIDVDGALLVRGIDGEDAALRRIEAGELAR